MSYKAKESIKFSIQIFLTFMIIAIIIGGFYLAAAYSWRFMLIWLTVPALSGALYYFTV